MKILSTMLNRLAALPLPAVGALLGLGAVLSAVHTLLVQQSATILLEWPQWLGRVTFGWYWVLLPLAVLALWARRRRTVPKIAYAGAVMAAIGIVEYALVTLGAVVWDGVLSRGELPSGAMWLEALGYLMMLGVLIIGAGMLIDKGTPRSWPLLLICGLVGYLVIPFLFPLEASYLVLAMILIVGRVKIANSSKPSSAELPGLS